MRIKIMGLEHLRGGVIVGITDDPPMAGILEVRILEEMKHPPIANDKGVGAVKRTQDEQPALS